LFATNTQNAVLTIRIDRPEKRNALTLAMREEFAALLLDADARDDVAAVVLTGTDPAFCAGVDLGEFGSNIMNAHDRRYRVNPTRAIFALRKPIVAAVNGACVSGGLEIAHASIGAMPSWGMTALLPRAVGVRLAKQISLTGTRFDAQRALGYGLVNEVVDHDALESRVVAITSAMVAADGHSVRQILDLYDRGDGASLPEALAFEADAIADRITDAAKVQQRGSAYRSGDG
jgi:enoyl-CoA hydratase